MKVDDIYKHVDGGNQGNLMYKIFK